MNRVSQSTAAAMVAETSTLVPITLLKIVVPSETLYFCNNNEDVISDGIRYQFYPFEIRFPQSTSSDEKIKSRITIGNIDQRIIAGLRSLQKPTDITISLVYVDASNDPPTSNDEEFGPITLKWKRQDTTAKTITGTLKYKSDFLNRQYLRHSFNPATASGMF